MLLKALQQTAESIFGIHFDPQGQQDSNSPSHQVVFGKWMNQFQSEKEDLPILFNGTFKQAAAEAKSTGSLLLIFIYSKWSSGVERMISQVYAAKSTWSKVLENERKVLIWVGNISEHHFAIELAARFKLASLPAHIHLAHMRGRLVALKTIYGNIQQFDFLNELNESLEAVEISTDLESSYGLSRPSSAQLLRDEQDLAYQRSLEADRRKEQERKTMIEYERLKEEEEARKAKEELELKKKCDKVAAKYRAEIPKEPAEGSGIKLSIMLPSGRALIRRFNKSDSINALYKYVFSEDPYTLADENFTIRTLLPLREFLRPPAGMEQGLDEAGISSNMKLIVEQTQAEDK